MLAPSVLLLALAGLLGACCTPVSRPESASPGQGSCAAYVPVTQSNTGARGGGGAENR
jgi:hypothetical protein